MSQHVVNSILESGLERTKAGTMVHGGSAEFAEKWNEREEYNLSKTHVLLVTNVFTPHIGGITGYVGMMEEILRGRASPRVMSYPARLVSFEASQGKNPMRILLHMGFVLRVLMAVILLRLRHRKVIVHSHSALFCLVAAVLSGFLGAQTIHTFHSPIERRSIFLRWLSPRLGAVVYVSPALQEMYEKTAHTANRRVAIVPGAVRLPTRLSDEDRERLRRQTREACSVPRDAFLILCVGRVVREKGTHVLAEAFAASDDGTDHVLIVGPPKPGEEGSEYMKEVLHLAGAGSSSGRFRILGPVPREALDNLYVASDVVAIPSIWPEPAPLVALEAMAHGIPVIATHIGGLQYLIPNHEAGLLVRPGDAAALASAIKRLRENRELRGRLGIGARDYVERKHTPDQFAEQCLRLYATLE